LDPAVERREGRREVKTGELALKSPQSMGPIDIDVGTYISKPREARLR